MKRSLVAGILCLFPFPQGELQAPSADEALEARIERVHRKVAPAVACLFESDDEYGESWPAGAAVVVSADGFVVTAAHCLGAPGEIVEVRLADGTFVDARTLGIDHDHDLGLMKIEGPGPFAYIGIHPRSERMVQDEVVLMYGYPDEVDPEEGAVVRLGTYLGSDSSGYLRTSCTMMPGDSGGPLVDLDGRLLGVNSEVELPLDQNYHAPLGALMRRWKWLSAGKVIGAPASDAFHGSEAETDEYGYEDSPDEGYAEDGALDRQLVLAVAAERAGGETPPLPAGEDVDPARRLPGGKAGLADRIARASAGPPAAKLSSRNGWQSAAALGVFCGDGRGGEGPFVVSKSSIVLDDMIRCVLPDRTLDTARVVLRDPANDLVLLRLENRTAPATRWMDEVRSALDAGEAVAPSVGELVASLGPPSKGSRALSAGMIGGGLHPVGQRDWGSLDAEFSYFEAWACLFALDEDGAGYTAGLRPGDVLRQLDGREVPRRDDVADFLDGTRPGQEVDIVYTRGGARFETRVTLGSWNVVNDEYWALEHVAFMQPLSFRRGSFQSVFRHDAHVEPEECGGPLVGLDGAAIGLNIARADRTGTLALPASVVLRFIGRGLSAEENR